jgi:hypothetical protein
MTTKLTIVMCMLSCFASDSLNKCHDNTLTAVVGSAFADALLIRGSLRAGRAAHAAFKTPNPADARHIALDVQAAMKTSLAHTLRALAVCILKVYLANERRRILRCSERQTF